MWYYYPGMTNDELIKKACDDMKKSEVEFGKAFLCDEKGIPFDRVMGEAYSKKRGVCAEEVTGHPQKVNFKR